jgi:alkylhydroperoxidase family enzyme
MAHISIPPGEGTERARVWQHKPAVGDALTQLAVSLYTDSLLTIREAELARMRVVLINGCHY